MILEETVNKFLRDIINLILVSPGFAIKAKQNAPRPAGAYASVDLISITRMGWEQRVLINNPDDPDLTETISGERQVSMSLSFYRDDSIDKASQVRIALIRESIQSLFRAANIAYVRSSEIREISEPLQEGWEDRAQFDIFLSIVGSDSDLIRCIESLDISGEYQYANQSYDFNIEV